MCLIRGAIQFFVCALLAGTILVSLPGSIAPGHAACTVSDVADAGKATYEFMKDMLGDPQCALLMANPAFWAVTGALKASIAAGAAPQMSDACAAVQQVASAAGDSIEKANSALDKLPPEVRKALQEKLPVEAVNEAYGGVQGPLAWADCACKVAKSKELATVDRVTADCFKDALCGLDALIFGNSCEAAPQGIKMVDCTKGVIGFGWSPVGGGLYLNKQGLSINNFEVGSSCTCPPPMKFGTIFFTNPKDYPGCYANGKVTTEGCRACVCPFPTKRVAMGVCVCPDGSPALPDGRCPAPCKGSCPPGQILKRSVRLVDGQCSSQCSCPPGQTMAGGKCEWSPCAAEGETRLPGGVCCAKDKVSACGTCCVGGQVPDAATGQCVAAPVASPAPPAPSPTPSDQNQQPPGGGAPPAAEPRENPKPILFRLPRRGSGAPFSPITW